MTTAESCESIIAEFNGKWLPSLTVGLIEGSDDNQNQQQPPLIGLIVKLADSSTRKSKRSTPRSFYSGDSIGFQKPKGLGTVTPLMSTPLMDTAVRVQ
jgi:hypothetical protein